MYLHIWSALTPCRAPTCGGQYHWVSEFAPPKYQKVLSYLTGMKAVDNLSYDDMLIPSQVGYQRCHGKLVPRLVLFLPEP